MQAGIDAFCVRVFRVEKKCVSEFHHNMFGAIIKCMQSFESDLCLSEKGTRVKYFLQRILKVCHIDFKVQYLAATWSGIDVNNNEQY